MADHERPIVSNTTPLIKLVGVGLLDLLPNIYGTITIAASVRDEYAAGMRPGDPVLERLPWVHIEEAVPHDASLPSKLDAGERATIALASAQNARAVLLDEQLARRVARQRGLPLVGTLGVLLIARQTGLIPAVRPVLDTMIAQGRRISAELRIEVLRAAGEEDQPGP